MLRKSPMSNAWAAIYKLQNSVKFSFFSVKLDNVLTYMLENDVYC